MSWRPSKELMTQIHHFTQFPQTSVSLQQMVQFGMIPSYDHMLIRRFQSFAWNIVESKSVPCRYVLRSKGLSLDELPVRLAHRVKDLDHLPDKLHEMPSILKVKNWYLQSFEVTRAMK